MRTDSSVFQNRYCASAQTVRRHAKMRQAIIILALISSLLTVNAQTGKRQFYKSCQGLLQFDTSEKTKQTLTDLGKLNAVTLGDAGETSAPIAYLARFDKFTTYFDSTYNDTILIQIIKKNYCPLVSCYAFKALVTDRDSTIDNQTLQNLIIPFAKDSNSFVNLDWGCGHNPIETFDYLMCLMTGHFWTNHYGLNIEPLDKTTIENLLIQRQDYYRKKDIYGRTISWSAYKDSFLK